MDRGLIEDLYKRTMKIRRGIRVDQAFTKQSHGSATMPA